MPKIINIELGLTDLFRK